MHNIVIGLLINKVEFGIGIHAKLQMGLTTLNLAIKVKSWQVSIRYLELPAEQTSPNAMSAPSVCRLSS